MPIVPTFNEDDLPQVMRTGPQIDIQSAGAPGQAVARAGATASDYATRFSQELQNQQNYDYSATNIAGARTKWTDEYLKRSRAAQQSGNYAGFAAQFNSDVASDLQQRVAGAPSPHAADMLQKTFANLQDEFSTKAVLFEHEGTVQTQKGNLINNLDSGATVAYRDPSQAESVYGQTMGEIHGAAAAGLLNPAEVAELGIKYRDRIYSGVVQHGIENTPVQTAADLRAGKFDALLSEPLLVQYQSRADAEVKAREADARREANENALMARGSVESAFQDNLASIKDTGRPAVPLSRAQLLAAYPQDPGRVDAMLDTLNRAQTGYVASQHVALTGPEQDAATLKNLTPSGAGYTGQAETYNTVLGAIQQKQKALNADQAAYVQSVSPQVRSLFQAAAQDPKKIPLAVAAQDAAYDQLGLPPDRRPVLTDDQASSIVSKLAGIDPAKGDVGGALNQLASNYGTAWPRVYADLVRAKLPPSYEMLGQMDAPAQLPARQDLQRALSLSAQKGGPKALEEVIGPAAATQIRTGLADELAPFQKSVVIPGAAENVDLLSKVNDTVKTLAQFYVVQGQDTSTALKNAYDGVIGSKYDFDGTMRVPRQVTTDAGDTVPLSIGQMRAATEQAAQAIRPADLRASAGLPPDIAADRWASAQRNASWFPTQNDDGLMMMVQTRDGRYIRVLKSDGTPVQVKFTDAAKLPNLGVQEQHLIDPELGK